MNCHTNVVRTVSRNHQNIAETMRLIKSNKYNRQVNDSLKASIRASVSIDILIEIIFKEIITDEWAVRNLTNESSDLNLHGLIFDLSLKHSQDQTGNYCGNWVNLKTNWTHFTITVWGHDFSSEKTYLRGVRRHNSNLIETQINGFFHNVRNIWWIPRKTPDKTQIIMLTWLLWRNKATGTTNKGKLYRILIEKWINHTTDTARESRKTSHYRFLLPSKRICREMPQNVNEFHPNLKQTRKNWTNNKHPVKS